MALLGCGAAKLQRLKNCEFSFSGITDVTISGQKLDDLKNEKKGGLMGSSLLSTFLFSKEVPVVFTVKISIKNPNTKVAALDKMEWTAFIQDKELLSGVFNQHFEIKPGETITLSIPVYFDLKEKLNSENGALLKSFGMGFMMNGSAKGLSIKVRPYLAGIKFPQAFEIKPF
jgi:hypothetical protein